MIKYEEDLKKLEEISIRISNLINNNEYEKILELDTHRKRIINEISRSPNSTSKNQISKMGWKGGVWGRARFRSLAMASSADLSPVVCTVIASCQLLRSTERLPRSHTNQGQAVLPISIYLEMYR